MGLALLAATTGLLEMRSIWGWVAALFVILGVWALVKSEFRNLVGPVMIITIAGAFFLRNVGVIPDGVLGTWWPLFVVLFGLLVMINRTRRQRRIPGQHTNEVTGIAIFGSDERRPVTETFTGGDLVAVFGDVRLDLRDADVGDQPAVVETIAMFGDADLIVPESWDVQLETINVFGETSDRRPRSDERGQTDEPQLVVTGVSMFGDIEIRDWGGAHDICRRGRFSRRILAGDRSNITPSVISCVMRYIARNSHHPGVLALPIVCPRET
ncbi:MAG: LiaF-related protein [Natrialbaceae archaeon]|nr:LiaF-related protein [Natrialbaceae archaeon]